MLSTAEIRSSEDDALEQLRPLLSQLLGAYLGQTTSTGTRGPDGIVYKCLDTCLAPLLCFEYKRVLGEGGCDPSTRAAYSLLELFVKDNVRGFRVFCTFVNTAFSSTTFSKGVAAHLSSSPVMVLVCPYSASSTPTSSSFNN